MQNSGKRQSYDNMIDHDIAVYRTLRDRQVEAWRNNKDAASLFRMEENNPDD